MDALAASASEEDAPLFVGAQHRLGDATRAAEAVASQMIAVAAIDRDSSGRALAAALADRRGLRPV
jgi:hypothetical protein